MIKKAVSVEEVVDLLNEAFKRDPKAIASLVFDRVECNAELASHPTIQVNLDENNIFSVGLLGIINGLFGIDDETGMGALAAKVDSHQLLGFMKIE